MIEKELLNDWLTRLYARLKEQNEEIEELESKMTYNKQLNELQLNRLSDWLALENIDLDIRDELVYSKEYLEELPEEDEEKLSLLRINRDTTVFMIDKIEKELRD